MNKIVKVAAIGTLLMVVSYAVINKNNTKKKSAKPPIEQKAVTKAFTPLAVTTFPEKINPQCREGIANIYDECGDQQAILDQAIKAATAADKRVLILYGAEWCLWCHVFDKYVKGKHKRFDYKWQYHDGDNLDWVMYEKENKRAEQEAQALNEFVSKHYVLTHIESYHAPNGEQVLADLGYDVEAIQAVPIIISLDKNGQIFAEMRSAEELIGLEKRQDNGQEFRGYDRKLLLSELKRMYQAGS